MSQYTTGEIARLCGVTVRTVQYYDARGILVPSSLSEGGRRLYSDEDLSKMKIICFLRELDLPIGKIGELMAQDNSGEVIHLLLTQQKAALTAEVGEKQRKLEKLEQLRKEAKRTSCFSVESIGDIARIMENRHLMRRFRRNLLLSAIPIGIVEWTAIILWITTGIWWPFAVYLLLCIPYSVWVTRYYFRKVSYICPQCHRVFRPTLREAFFARHTPSLRKLRCTACGYRGFCVEICDTPTSEAE